MIKVVLVRIRVTGIIPFGKLVNVKPVVSAEKIIDDPDKLTPLIVEKRGSNPVFRAVLRASSDVPYRYMQLVMAACAKADVDNITFMVLDKEGKKKYDGKDKAKGAK